MRVRRRAFLVWQKTKLKVKIQGVLAYEGIKPLKKRSLFTRKGAEWLRSLGLDPVDCYLRLMELLKEEIRLLSKEHQGLARDDQDVRLLITVPGVDYYIVLLMRAEIGDFSRFSSVDYLASYAGLVSSTRSSGGVDRLGISPRRVLVDCRGL